MNRLNALAREGKINENASVRDQHSIIINQPIDKVWDVLLNLEEWSSWNPDVQQMKISDTLEVGTHFECQIGGKKSKSQIQQLKRPNLLSWTGTSSWIKRIYVWNLEADENQTIVTLSTSLEGFLTVLVISHQKVYSELLNWLQQLKENAESE